MQWLDDMCLCRYLRARDWDLEKAEVMIRGTLAWREDYKPEEITALDIEAQSKTGKVSIFLHSLSFPPTIKWLRSTETVFHIADVLQLWV